MLLRIEYDAISYRLSNPTYVRFFATYLEIGIEYNLCIKRGIG
jgi:hypothetical protein